METAPSGTVNEVCMEPGSTHGSCPSANLFGCCVVDVGLAELPPTVWTSCFYPGSYLDSTARDFCAEADGTWVDAVP
jgi:hypothetical protein